MELATAVLRLIPKIMLAAEKAQQNKKECDRLASRASEIAKVMPHLQRQPEVGWAVAGLRDTLNEAHELLVACSPNSNVVSQLINNADVEKFSQVNARIDSHLLDLITCRFTHQIPSPSNRAGVSNLMVFDHAASPTAPPFPASGSSRSLQLQLESAATMVPSYVSSPNPPKRFTSAEIVMMTNQFTRELGQDRFGTVYMGCVHGGPQVAVRRMKNKHGQPGEEEDDDAFKVELKILRDICPRHDHIVSLEGWCEEDGDRMLVYDYKHWGNGTLGDYLRGGGGPVLASLIWRMRIKALLGASRAIDHLHRGMPPVIHRDITSSNILMDASWAPRLSSFGAAVLETAPTSIAQGQPMGKVDGTFGYIDPEYDPTRRASPASDVYSFGVVILEALTGMPPVGVDHTKTVVNFALPAIRKGKLKHVLDRQSAPEPTSSQMEALNLVADTAVFCLMPAGEDRPAMSRVVSNLDTALGQLL